MTAAWPRLMDRKTAGEYLQVSEWVIRQYRDAGDLPVTKIRSLERYDRNDLDALVDRLKIADGAA
jgi:hypothetical protein